jgi:hypothetical protein
MSWLKTDSKEHPEEIRVLKLRFLGEQDGVPERDLKRRLTGFFWRDRSILTAYLARVTYGEQSLAAVALCLRSKFGPDRGVAEKIGKIFASLFGDHEHLDIIFLADEQESELAKVCPPFFEDVSRSR